MDTRSIPYYQGPYSQQAEPSDGCSQQAPLNSSFVLAGVQQVTALSTVEQQDDWLLAAWLTTALLF
jgi:hypothetical protein